MNEDVIRQGFALVAFTIREAAWMIVAMNGIDRVTKEHYDTVAWIDECIDNYRSGRGIYDSGEVFGEVEE